MKTTIVKTVLIILITTLVIACNDDEAPVDNEIVTRQLIKSEEVLNDDDNTKQTHTLAYRNYSLIDNYQINVSTATLNVNVSYDQNDRVESTSVNGMQVINYTNNGLQLEQISSNNGTSVTDLVYDANGNVSQAISKKYDDDGNEVSSRTNNFTYNQDDSMQSMTYQVNNQYNKYTFDYGSNKNLTQITLQWDSTDGINFNRTRNYTITYDNKVNPSYVYLFNMNTLTNGWTFHDMPRGNGLFEEVFFQDLGNGHYIKFYGVNNVLTNDSNFQVESYEYTYDTYNYPTKVIENRIDRNTNPDTRYTKEYSFFYQEI